MMLSMALGTPIRIESPERFTNARHSPTSFAAFKVAARLKFPAGIRA